MTVATAVITPIAKKDYDIISNGGWILLLAALVLHLIGLGVLQFYDAEE